MTAHIHDWAGKGIGVNPTGTDYPFVAPGTDMAGLLADLWIEHTGSSIVGPLRITWIRGLDLAFTEEPEDSLIEDSPNHPVDLVIKDANNATVLDTRVTLHYRARDYGPRLRIHEWLYLPYVVCRIVQHTAFASVAEVRTIPNEIIPDNGILHARCHTALSQRVTGLTVGDDVLDEGIQFAAGHNMQLSLSTNVSGYGLRRVNRITVNAEAGAGLGIYDDCPEEDECLKWTKINGTSVSGNAQLLLDGCYWLRPELTYEVTGTEEEPGLLARFSANQLVVGNDCDPCCLCRDYVNVFESLRKLYDVYADLGSRAEIARDLYQENRDRWLEQKHCRENNNVFVSVATYDCTEADISIGICNTRNYCLKDVEVQITINFNTDGVSRRAESSEFALRDIIRNDTRGGADFYNLFGSNPLTAHWDYIEQGSSGQLSFRLSLPAPTTDSISVVVTATSMHKSLGPAVTSLFTIVGCADEDFSSLSESV